MTGVVFAAVLAAGVTFAGAAARLDAWVEARNAREDAAR